MSPQLPDDDGSFSWFDSNQCYTLTIDGVEVGGSVGNCGGGGGSGSTYTEGGGGRPQNTSSGARPNDCMALADYADRFAREAYTDSDFVARMVNRLLSRSGTPAYAEFRARGFYTNFQDEGEGRSFNQVRHFVVGMSVSYGGAIYARLELGALEWLSNTRVPTRNDLYEAGVDATNRLDDSSGDKALNAHSIRIGVDLAYGEMGRSRVGQYIRDHLCDPKY